MTNQARFTINSLLEGKSALVHITPVASDGTLLGSPVPGLQGSKGLGLEIENIAALPDAGDYSQHEFYLANFTPSEIAYCTKEPKTKAAFQGLLAAKRAIIKSGAVSNPPEGHRSIEITPCWASRHAGHSGWCQSQGAGEDQGVRGHLLRSFG